MEPELINPRAHAYAERFSSPEDDVLRQVSLETQRSHPHAHMLSGHLQGRFLQFISEMMHPLNILEIGTFTGYSGICLARGLQPSGKLHTIELREDDARTATKNFNLAGMQDRIILYPGNALDIIPGLNYPWDLVFIDADKPAYLDYYRLVLNNLRKGGIILADNVLFHGEVLDEEITGKNATAIHEFNEYVRKDERVSKIMMTIRDGLSIIIKN